MRSHCLISPIIKKIDRNTLTPYNEDAEISEQMFFLQQTQVRLVGLHGAKD